MVSDEFGGIAGRDPSNFDRRETKRALDTQSHLAFQRLARQFDRRA
jgi:hypothetical protein